MKRIRESRQKRILKVTEILRKTYPGAQCALRFRNAWQLLVATVLSAQCTDKRVNLVTPGLFRKYPKPSDLAGLSVPVLGREIHSTGFYRNKAGNLIAMAKQIETRFRGKVPKRLEDLVSLPGVGRKTANVVLGYAYGIPGLTVDTHMIRLNRRLGFTRERDPVKIEFDLMPLVLQQDWTHYSSLIIYHGRNRCFARNPDCVRCEIRALCPSADKAESQKG